MISSEPAASDYIIRRMRPDDAPAVTACVQGVYGDSYTIHSELYHPERIVRLNESGQLVSFVVLETGGAVVAHYAIERPDLGPIGETGEAMVLPAHRHHHLLERLRTQLVEEARRLGMVGLFGQPVTNHTFSQKMYEHADGHPCGVSLGITPASFHNMPEPLTQRLTCLLYFQYLRKPSGVVAHVPAAHRELVGRIYGLFGVPVSYGVAAPATQPGALEVSRQDDLQFGLIRVRTVGSDSTGALRRAHDELCRARVEVIHLEVPLAQPAAPLLCQTAEELGFFFSALGPHFAADGDALRLQYLRVPLDLAILKVEHPFARELLAYIGRERERVGRHA